MLELIGELHAAARVDGVFEAGDAVQAPGGIGEGLDERGFPRRGGLELCFEVVDVVLVGGAVAGGQEDGAAGECSFEGVER